MSNFLNKARALTSAVVKVTTDVTKDVTNSSKIFLKLSEARKELEDNFVALGRAEYQGDEEQKVILKEKIKSLELIISDLEAELESPSKKQYPETGAPVEGEIEKESESVQAKEAEPFEE